MTSGTSTFRDLNHNGTMEPHEDPRLPVAERVTDLLGRMTLEEKAGQMVHNSIAAGPDGELRGDGGGASGLSAHERIVDNHITHLNVHYLPAPALAARWANRMQELAAGTRLGIPVSLSSDPRHAFREHQGVSFASRGFSQWPEQIGLAAVRDPDLVERYGDIVRREYRAVGLSSALHPTIDLATEPRWARQMGTFGQDAGLTSELVRAYLRGLQGDPRAVRGGGDDQALPGRWAAARRGGPALPVRLGPGLPRGRVRDAPGAVPCRDRRGDVRDHAVLRQAGRARPPRRSDRGRSGSGSTAR